MQMTVFRKQRRSKSFSSFDTTMTSEEDDLLLGAEAKSVVHQNFKWNDSSTIRTNIKGLDMTGKAGKSAADGDNDDTAEDVDLDLEQESGLQTSLTHQESQNSENSVSLNSLDQILEERKGDPEMILQNLGFSGSYSGINCRIPDRFLVTPSNAYGISVEKFLEGNPKLREFLEEKNAIQNPFEMMMTTSAEGVPVEKRRRARTGSGGFYQAALTVTMVNRFKRLIGKGCWASLIHGGVPVAEAVVRETPWGCRYWSVLPSDNREYLEKSGYYDELWSAVSVTCDPSVDSKLMSVHTTDRKSAAAESTSPKLLCVTSELVSKQSQRLQVEHSPAYLKGSLMFPWSRPSGSSDSVQKADDRPTPDSTPNVRIEGNGPQFQPQPNAKNIPGRFLANPSVLVPNDLMIFSESKLDLDVQQSMSEDSSAMAYLGTEISERTGLKNELPTTESLDQEHNDHIMLSRGSCSVEMGDCTDWENRLTSSLKDSIAVSAAMDSEDSGRSELSQTLMDSANDSRCLIPSGCTIFETNGICVDKKLTVPHDTSSPVSSVYCGECADGVTVPVSDGLDLSSAADIHSDPVAASNYSLDCKSSPARKGRFSLRDFRAFSIDVPETCTSNDPRMTSTFDVQSRLKDDLIHQISIQSDSSGFTEGDQLDVSLLSINDVLAPSNRLRNMDTHRLKDASGQCSKFSVRESPDFMNSHCTRRPFSVGSDDFFHRFSQSSYKMPHCAASTQTDSLNVSSVSPHRCFSSAQNISQSATNHHGVQQNLLNTGATSKIERKTTTKSDVLCVALNDGSCVVSGDCVSMSDGNASKQYRTEVKILINQSTTKLQNLETSRVILSESSAYDFSSFNKYNRSSSLEGDVVNKKNNRNHKSVICRLDQSSPIKGVGLSRSTVASLDGHQSEIFMSGHSSPIRYHSNNVSCYRRSLSGRDQNQAKNFRDSFDLQESYNNWSGGTELSPSSDDSGSTSVFCEGHDECFPDVSEHQMLQDQLENSGFVSSLNWPSTPTSSAQKWKQCTRDELKLMDFALRKYKLQNKLLRRRMCKSIKSSGCSSSPGVLPHDERDDLDMLEILHTGIMEELDRMEELLMQRLKRFLRSHGYEDEKHPPLSDFTSQCILHSMTRLLHEQDYQSNIVSSINCTGSSDHLSITSPPLLTSPPPLLSSPHPLLSSPSPHPLLSSPSPLLPSPPPLLLHSVPIVSLQQLSQCLASVELLLLEMQRKTDVMEKNSTSFQQPLPKLLDPKKDLKSRKSYHRFLPACLKPQWPKKQPVFKQQMSLSNTKEDH